MAASKTDETTAEAFLNTAQQYHSAARALLPLREQVESPLYFLFAHAIELALKAYLRSCGLSTPRGQQGHALLDLLEACHRNGLRVGVDLPGVIRLLELEHGRHGFRYFIFEGIGRPSIDHLREVVDDLMRVIGEEVAKRPSTTPPAAVLKFVVGRPEKK